MALAPGTQIDRYEVIAPLGQGAMGEVYRARDSRLGREVAIKILPAAFSTDAERLRRFDQEARAAGTLNHPNVLAIYDVGAHGGAPFVVSELLEGETLRDRLAGSALPIRKVIEYGVQVARGLAAAHAKGIVHRDLKPENLFVTADGHVKILDFGLAKLRRPEGLEGGADSLMGTLTNTGLILGTVGYMAPEQVRGEATDHRTDIFALGCVLYEMATGARAFHRVSPVETMYAILRDDPPDFPAEVKAAAPGLLPLVRRCVEKLPGERFESARDLAFSLEVLAAGTATEKREALIGGAAATRADPVSEVAYHRISFRRGMIWSARFTPDGHSVVYSAAWEGKPLELFWAHIGNPEARSLGLRDTDLLGVSPSNELAVLLRMAFVSSFDRSGTLARVPPMGGAARELLHDVHEADWSPDGTQLAVVRDKEGMARIEYPLGKLLYQTAGWVSQMRISRDGERIVFIDHPNRTSDSGTINLVDRKGELRVLSEDWGTARGLAWSADGKDVWFTADRGGAARGIYAVALDGKVRRVLQVASNLTLHDVARDGRVLVAHGTERAGISGLAPGESRERDLSWLDWSLLQDISSDGRLMLLDESAEGGGASGSIYVRPTDGSPAVRLGDGVGRGFSPDGQWVLGNRYGIKGVGQLYLIPTGVGEPLEVPTEGLHSHAALWLPDGKRIVIAGHEPGHGIRLYRMDLETGDWRAFSPEGVEYLDFQVLPDGQSVSAFGSEFGHRIYPLEGGEPRPIPWLDRSERVIRWAGDGRSAFIYRSTETPVRIYRVDIETGERTLWRELTPPDPTGIYRIARIRMSADGSAYAYNYYMQLLDLHVIEGLR